jgi:hypothetical protein
MANVPQGRTLRLSHPHPPLGRMVLGQGRAPAPGEVGGDRALGAAHGRSQTSSHSRGKRAVGHSAAVMRPLQGHRWASQASDTRAPGIDRLWPRNSAMVSPASVRTVTS